MGGLKGPTCLLIVVVALALVGSSSAAPAPVGVLRNWRVDVVDGLSGGQTLFVHCKSKDDDLGEHNLGGGADFGWSFKDNIWGTTLFWCYMRKPNNANASFDVFWYENAKPYRLYDRCNWENCIWTAKDDAIYLKNIPLNKDELVHIWG